MGSRPRNWSRITSDDTLSRLSALIEQDLKAETSAANIDAVERLVRYQRDLVTLLTQLRDAQRFLWPAEQGHFPGRHAVSRPA
jgi:hypothetical protein